MSLVRVQLPEPKITAVFCGFSLVLLRQHVSVSYNMVLYFCRFLHIIYTFFTQKLHKKTPPLRRCINISSQNLHNYQIKLVWCSVHKECHGIFAVQYRPLGFIQSKQQTPVCILGGVTTVDSYPSKPRYV